jgi:hypothetical protein
MQRPGLDPSDSRAWSIPGVCQTSSSIDQLNYCQLSKKGCLKTGIHVKVMLDFE